MPNLAEFIYRGKNPLNMVTIFLLAEVHWLCDQMILEDSEIILTEYWMNNMNSMNDMIGKPRVLKT